MDPTDLFVRLAKRRPTAARESFEDFFTELVGHLLRSDPESLRGFVDEVFGPAKPDAGVADIKVHTQEQFRTESGKIVLDLVLRLGSEMFIVEHKIDDELMRGQLDRYLEYAQEAPAKVAVISRDGVDWLESPPYKQHPSFAGARRWSALANRWRQVQCPEHRWLREAVIALMKDRGMVDWSGTFTDEEARAVSRWAKLYENLEGARRVVTGETAGWSPDSRLQRRDLPYRGNVWGIDGVVYYLPLPTKPGPGDSPFWVFLGFALHPSSCLPSLASDERKPELWVLAGFWGPLDRCDQVFERARAQARGVCNDIDRASSADNDGSFLLRRRPVVGLDRPQLVKFVEEAKRAFESGTHGAPATLLLDCYGTC